MTRNDALEALDDIVTAYCLSLGMNPPRPDPESQTAEQVRLIKQALTGQPSPDVEQEIKLDTRIFDIFMRIEDGLTELNSQNNKGMLNDFWHNCHQIKEDVEKLRMEVTAKFVPPSPDVECVQKMHELESPDVEALKRGPANEDEAMCQVTSIYNDGWNHCIEELHATGHLSAKLPKIDGLENALMNAVKPSFDIHTRCPQCSAQIEVDSGEWLIWCGEKEHAEAILQAARAYRERSK